MSTLRENIGALVTALESNTPRHDRQQPTTSRQKLDHRSSAPPLASHPCRSLPRRRRLHPRAHRCPATLARAHRRQRTNRSASQSHLRNGHRARHPETESPRGALTLTPSETTSRRTLTLSRAPRLDQAPDRSANATQQGPRSRQATQVGHLARTTARHGTRPHATRRRFGNDRVAPHARDRPTPTVAQSPSGPPQREASPFQSTSTQRPHPPPATREHCATTPPAHRRREGVEGLETQSPRTVVRPPSKWWSPRWWFYDAERTRTHALRRGITQCL